jgi:hypothetical protein
VPDLAFGFGYPLFNFYAPLFYFLAGGVHLLGLNIELAVKVTLALLMLLGAGGMYALAREWFDEPGAILAAVAYTYAPFHLRELYFQGDYAQYLGMALPPLILWSLHRLGTLGKRRYFVIAAAGYAALIMSHSISTMLFTPLIVAYVLLLCLTRPAARQRAGLLALALILGAGLSAWFLLPALYERPWVQINAVRSGDYNVLKNFPPLRDLIAASTPLDLNAVIPYQPFDLGLAQLAFAVPGLWLLVRRPARWVVLFGCLALAGCVFMMTPLSGPVWQTIPLLSFAQFPWRWLAAAALPLALLVGAAAEAWRRGRNVYVVIASAAIIVSIFPQLYPRNFTRYDHATVADEVTGELLTQAIGTTSAGEYLPAAVKAIPRTSPMVPALLDGKPVEKLDRASLPAGAQATTVAHGALKDQWQVNSPVAFQARVYTFYYPGWTAYVDGQPAAIQPSAPDGLITVEMPAGAHDLALRFESTPDRQAAAALSLLALVAVGMCLLEWPRLARALHAQPVEGTALVGRSLNLLDSRAVWALGGLALLLVVAKTVYIDPSTNWFRAATNLDAIPGLAHVSKVNFDHQAELIGETVAQHAARPGETVAVSLYWQALQPMTTPYRSFMQLMGRTGGVGQSDHVHPGGVPTTAWIPGQFLRDEHLVAISADAPPGVYRFRTGLYSGDAKLPIVDAGSGDYLIPEPIRIGSLPSPAATTVNCRLGEHIQLVAYQILNPVVHPGEAIRLRLFWRTDAKIDRDYNVLVHLHDANGQQVGVGDRLPLEGDYGTSLWQPGEIIEDAQQVASPTGAQSGDYRIRVGLYDVQTMQRLTALDAQGKNLPEDTLTLDPTVRVVAP